jgi:hypothetical protein
MSRLPALAALAAGTALYSQPGFAHGLAGAHLFVSTLILDDPNVADEASLPTFSYLPLPSSGDPAPSQSILGFEFDKRITENVGFGISSGYAWLRQPGNKTANGWQNLSVTLKYKPYVNAEHEFMMSIGVERDFARTGANGSNGAALDNDDVGSTTPLIYFGKGFGDIPVGWLRPFVLTGEFGYRRSGRRARQQRRSEPVDRWGVAAIQHPLPAIAGEGFRSARIRQPADAAGRAGLDLTRHAAEQLHAHHVRTCSPPASTTPRPTTPWGWRH